jgi:hypothetical protein
MTLRMVTPASGAAQLSISYNPGGLNGPETDMLTAGQILDVIPGSALETAIGVTNLTTLSATMLNNALTGSDGQATGNV